MVWSHVNVGPHPHLTWGTRQPIVYPFTFNDCGSISLPFSILPLLSTLWQFAHHPNCQTHLPTKTSVSSLGLTRVKLTCARWNSSLIKSTHTTTASSFRQLIWIDAQHICSMKWQAYTQLWEYLKKKKKKENCPNISQPLGYFNIPTIDTNTHVLTHENVHMFMHKSVHSYTPPF